MSVNIILIIMHETLDSFSDFVCNGKTSFKPNLATRACVTGTKSLSIVFILLFFYYQVMSIHFSTLVLPVFDTDIVSGCPSFSICHHLLGEKLAIRRRTL